MGVINVLDFTVANLIAAGEVVDRPASAVKELLENALDAGARHITVEIKAGGIQLIRVSDDGCGMSRDDVPVCIKRHATSKIHEATDLDGIMTLGFRGEALAAIASVSKLRIMTKCETDNVGTLLICDCGNIIDISDTGCHDGTTIIIEELFANIPARRKFLKRDVTEAMAVTAVVEKIALSRPDIAIRFINDGSVRIDTAGDGKLANTIYSVLGREFAKKMIAVDGLTEGIGVNGYISSPDNVRGNRNYQNFFINGRYIKSNAIMSGLEEAYNSYIPSERFPSCVLNLTVHPAYVDVNVHPTKLEVKFSNDKYVFNAVYCAVRNALTSSVRRPEMELRPDVILTGADVKIVNAFTSIDDKVADETEKKESKPSLFDETSPIQESAPPVKVKETKRSVDSNKSDGREMVSKPPLEDYIPKSPEDYDTTPPIPAETPAITDSRLENYDRSKLPYYCIIGCLFKAYIIVELDDRAMIIDKHAAHERILFEEMKLNMNSVDIYPQMMLIPIKLAVTGEEADALESYREEITSLGIDYSTDNGSVSINAIPPQLDAGEATAMLQTLASGLTDGTISVNVEHSVIFEKALYQASCKAAMKAGREDGDENLRWIVESLLKLPEVKFCPHGRPVAYDLTKHEIERQFKRV